MTNKQIANILNETADLMEIADIDGFRVRSYRNAAIAVNVGGDAGEEEEDDRPTLKRR